MSQCESGFGDFANNNFKLYARSLIDSRLPAALHYDDVVGAEFAEMAATSASRPRSWPDPDAERVHTRAYTRQLLQQQQQQQQQQQLSHNAPALDQQQPAVVAHPSPGGAPQMPTAGVNGQSN